MSQALSRRRLLAVAGAGLAGSASAAALAACGADETGGDGGEEAPTDTAAQGGSAGSADVVILNQALDLEFASVAAYTAAGRELRGAELQAAHGFLAQEQQHADALAQAIRQLGATPNRPRADYGLPELGGAGDALELISDSEERAIATYIGLLPKLTSPDLRGTAAAILTNEAEHLAVVREARGRPPAPDALVTGRR